MWSTLIVVVVLSKKVKVEKYACLSKFFHKFGTFCPEVRRGTREGLSYTPCLLMKPTLCLRLHDTQSQPCFPAASNALALPVGNLIFAATPTERITHYTLQAKSCAKGIPFGNPILSERVATLTKKQTDFSLKIEMGGKPF